MEVLLDTNFILTCVKQKVDFFSIANESIDGKIKWLIPFEVLAELEDLSTRKDIKGVDKDAAKLSLEMIKLISPEIVSVKNKNVDQGIVDYIRDKDIVLATLDKALKNKVKNRIMVIKDVKRVDIV